MVINCVIVQKIKENSYDKWISLEGNFLLV